MAENRKIRIVFLCSGGGGNLRFIYSSIKNGWINGEIVSVLTDRLCQANTFAQQVNLENRKITFNDTNQNELLRNLNHLNPDIIITTVHKILCPAIVESYRGKLINLHYSLLPAFGGTIGERPIRSAVDYGARFTGVTVHYVDETVDGGRPITQAVIPIKLSDSNHLIELSFRAGCIALMNAINIITNKESEYHEFSQLTIFLNTLTISGSKKIPTTLNNEIFWKSIS